MSDQTTASDNDPPDKPPPPDSLHLQGYSSSGESACSSPSDEEPQVVDGLTDTKWDIDAKDLENSTSDEKGNGDAGNSLANPVGQLTIDAQNTGANNLKATNAEDMQFSLDDRTVVSTCQIRSNTCEEKLCIDKSSSPTKRSSTEVSPAENAETSDEKDTNCSHAKIQKEGSDRDTTNELIEGGSGDDDTAQKEDNKETEGTPRQRQQEEQQPQVFQDLTGQQSHIGWDEVDSSCSRNYPDSFTASTKKQNERTALEGRGRSESCPPGLVPQAEQFFQQVSQCQPDRAIFREGNGTAVDDSGNCVLHVGQLENENIGNWHFNPLVNENSLIQTDLRNWTVKRPQIFEPVATKGKPAENNAEHSGGKFSNHEAIERPLVSWFMNDPLVDSVLPKSDTGTVAINATILAQRDSQFLRENLLFGLIRFVKGKEKIYPGFVVGSGKDCLQMKVFIPLSKLNTTQGSSSVEYVVVNKKPKETSIVCKLGKYRDDYSFVDKFEYELDKDHLNVSETLHFPPNDETANLSENLRCESGMSDQVGNYDVNVQNATTMEKLDSSLWKNLLENKTIYSFRQTQDVAEYLEITSMVDLSEIKAFKSNSKRLFQIVLTGAGEPQFHKGFVLSVSTEGIICFKCIFPRPRFTRQTPTVVYQYLLAEHKVNRGHSEYVPKYLGSTHDNTVTFSVDLASDVAKPIEDGLVHFSETHLCGTSDEAPTTRRVKYPVPNSSGGETAKSVSNASNAHVKSYASVTATSHSSGSGGPYRSMETDVDNIPDEMLLTDQLFMDTNGRKRMLRNVIQNREFCGEPERPSIELNVLIGSDICALKKDKLWFGVATSLDNFASFIPGNVYTFCSDDHIWMKVFIPLKYPLNYLQYKFVVVDITQPKPFKERVCFEKLFGSDPNINRSLNADIQGTVLYCGRILFITQDKENTKSRNIVFKFIQRSLESVGFANKDFDTFDNFYRVQSSVALKLYFERLLSCCFEKCHLSHNLESFLYIPLMLDTIRVGSTKQRLFSREEMFIKIVEVFKEVSGKLAEKHGGEEIRLKLLSFLLLHFLPKDQKLPVNSWKDVCDIVKFESPEQIQKVKLAFSEIIDPSTLSSLREKISTFLAPSLQLTRCPQWPVLIDWAFLDQGDGVTTKRFLNFHSHSLPEFDKKELKALEIQSASSDIKRHLLLLSLKKVENDELFDMFDPPLSDPVYCFHYLVKNYNRGRILNKVISLCQKIATARFDSGIYTHWELRTVANLIFEALEVIDTRATYEQDQESVKMLILLQCQIIEKLEVGNPDSHPFFVTERGNNSDGFSALLRLVEKNYLARRESFTEAEFLFWSKILTLTNMPESKHKLWHESVLPLFRKKLDKISELYLLEAYPQLPIWTKKHYPGEGQPVMESLFDEFVITEMNRLIMNGISIDVYLNSIYSVEIYTAISEMAAKAFPPIEENASIAESISQTLKFTNFLPFVRLMGKSEQLSYAFTSRLERVGRVFQIALDSINNNSVDAVTLRVILSNADLFQEVCTKLELQNYEMLPSQLNLCIQQLKTISAHVKTTKDLLGVVAKCHNEEVKIDVSTFSNFIKNWESEPLCNLVQCNPSLLQPAVPILQETHVSLLKELLRINESRYFTKTFKIYLRLWGERNENAAMSCEEFLENHFRKHQATYCDTGRSIMDGIITIEECRNIFSEWDDKDKAEELKFLFMGVLIIAEAQGDRNIRMLEDNRRRQILHIEAFLRTATLANLFKQLRDLLHLEGDFTQLDNWNNKETVLRYPLNQLTDEVLAYTQLFTEFVKKDEDALKAFIECPTGTNQHFLEWVKTKMPTLQDLKVVAELISLSAGEVQMDVERVQAFYDSIYGYASFIYDLPTESGLPETLEAYKKIREKLDSDSRLPKKLEDSIRHQDWFNKALETQGSVEKSSLERAHEINKHGVYVVGYNRERENSKVLITSDDVISLIMQNEENVEKRKFKLTDLRDLLSRLMLIVGKDKSDQVQTVEVFITMFQNIERLASAYVSLYNSGCVFFHSWTANVRNNSEDSGMTSIEITSKDIELRTFANANDELSCLCQAFEIIEDQWSKYVSSMRLRHPDLNYYNIQQLTILCSGLGTLKETGVLDPETHVQLRVMNKAFSGDDILRLLLEAPKSSEEDETMGEQTIEDMIAEASLDIFAQRRDLVRNLMNQHIEENAIKAAIIATNSLDDTTIVEWTMDHNHEEENIVDYAKQFDEEYDGHIRQEGNTVSGKQSTSSDFSSKIEKMFNCYLTDLRSDVLSNFVNLDQLGYVLDKLTRPDENNDVVMEPAELALFRSTAGQPNLVSCKDDCEQLLRVISLYRYATDPESLPNFHQVLYCTQETSPQELEVFLLRAMLDREANVFAISHAEKMSPDCVDVFEKVIERVKDCKNPKYRLVVFSKSDAKGIVSLLQKYHLPFDYETPEVLQKYLNQNLLTSNKELHQQHACRLVLSSQPSAGKSLFIDRVEFDQRAAVQECERVTVRLYERHVDLGRVLDMLAPLNHSTKPTLIHFDVSPNILEGVEELLFRLCVLGGLSDARGKIFTVTDKCCLLFETLLPQERSSERTLADLLPVTFCRSPMQILSEKSFISKTSWQICGADEQLLSYPDFQRPVQYLQKLNLNQDVENFAYDSAIHVSSTEVIQELKRFSGLANPTWAQLSYFAKFLNMQLEACENNVFVMVARENFVGFKRFLIKHCLLTMAQDFALPSLNISDASPLFGLEKNNYDVHQTRRSWEETPRPYVFFNQDQSTFTFLGFRVENGDLIDWKNNIMARSVMSQELENSIKRQAYDEANVLGENFDQLNRQRKIIKLCRVLGVDREFEWGRIQDDTSYELTQDNVMKLLAIYLRMKCDIPVVLIGETGCGKTRLIQFLCRLLAKGSKGQNTKFVKVHGGVTAADIVNDVLETEKLAKRNSEQFGDQFFTVLFFDEANTTEAIYAIKEVVCDFSVSGRPLDRGCGLKVIVACNPYKKHDEKMIAKLEKQGLGYHVKSSDTKDKLDSDIPMRHLVYRVNPLPPSLLPLVWDFGQLTSEVENKYITQIINGYAKRLKLNIDDCGFICNILSISQSFLREKRDQCLFVSLRDVERVMQVLTFFHSKKELLLDQMDTLAATEESDDVEILNEISRLVILAVGVCYHSSLDDREPYRKALCRAFRGDYELQYGEKSILKQIKLCQDVFLSNIKLDDGANIAKNLALTENVFMMIICIELRIPLFLVGKPGSSKSLAKTIVMDAMQGERSKNEFFRQLKQTQMLSFQCSPHTHADGIISMFRQAALYQRDKSVDTFASVVVLDEIGLAEDSPKMPLKTLHPLLEEGYVQETHTANDENDKSGKVSFVGISNWALDPAKMNRGLLVSRDNPGKEELIKSARGICKVLTHGKCLDKHIPALAEAYSKIYDSQDNEFFGLRDFYGLLKMLYRELQMSEHSNRIPGHVFERAVRRNFGGKNDSNLQIFANELQDEFEITMETETESTTTIDLVRENLQEAENRSKMTEEERNKDTESRYLLLMTENFVALNLLPRVLDLDDAEVIFGSSFPLDQDYIQVCRNINRIKICMETGRTLVLLNLGSLYESLYDALNQYYVYYAGKRFVDLGLGSNRVKCSVKENFRLILIEEEKNARRFPIPLLNRLEKHFLGMQSIMPPQLNDLRKQLAERVLEFSHKPRNDKENEYFKVSDVFIGFQQDTTAYVIMETVQGDDFVDEEIVFSMAIRKMFQTCTFDSLLRSTADNLPYSIESFEKEGRHSLKSFLLVQCYSGNKSRLIEITTFCRIPGAPEIKAANRELMEETGLAVTDDRHFVLNLPVFKTEHDFLERAKFFIKKSRDIEGVKMLFVTCSGSNKSLSLISSAKYCLQNLLKQFSEPYLSIIFLVELPRKWKESSYCSFSVGRWDCFHIDDLLKDTQLIKLTSAVVQPGLTLVDLFSAQNQNRNEYAELQRALLHLAVQEAVAESTKGIKDGNNLKRVVNISRLFNEEHDPSLETIFLEKAVKFIKDNEEPEELTSWVSKNAADLHQLIISGSIERSVVNELSRLIKHPLSNFLKVIDFNDNIDLLFEGQWRRSLWISMFLLRETSTKPLRKIPPNFRARFPFCNEIFQSMKEIWSTCMEEYNDSTDSNETFALRFCNMNPELSTILSTLNSEEDALCSFIRDLIFMEFEVDYLRKNEKVISVIQKTVMLDASKMSAEAPFVCYAFAAFQAIIHDLNSVLPILANVSSVCDDISKFDPLKTSVGHFMLQAAIKIVEKDLKKCEDGSFSSFKNFSRDIAVTEMCGMQMNLEEPKKDVLRKLSLLGSYLNVVTQGLDGRFSKSAAQGSHLLYKSIKEQPVSFFHDVKFISRLLFIMKRSITSVVGFTAKEEIGDSNCGFCRKDSSIDKLFHIPFKLPCGHLAHSKCRNDRLSGLMEQQCVSCGRRFGDGELQSATLYACTSPKFSAQWSRYMDENLQNVFIFVVKSYVLNSEISGAGADLQALLYLVRECLIYNSDKSVDTFFLSKNSRQILLQEIISQPGLEVQIEGAIKQVFCEDEESGARNLNIEESLHLLLRTYESIHSNKLGKVNVDYNEQEDFINQVKQMAILKADCCSLCDDLAVAFGNRIAQNKVMRKLIQLGEEITFNDSVRDSIQLLTTEHIFFTHGMEMYKFFHGATELHQLLPAILLNPESEAFNDLNLVLGKAYSDALDLANTDMYSNSLETATNRLEHNDKILQNLVAHRVLLEAKSRQRSRHDAVLQYILQNQVRRGFLASLFDNSRLSCVEMAATDLTSQLLNILYCAFEFYPYIGVLQPLKQMLDDPNVIDASLLPTFPDSLQRQTDALRGATGFTSWNQCPNGHMYVIGDCGRPVAQGRCPDCNATVGGQQHVFAPGNAGVQQMQGPVPGYPQRGNPCTAFDRGLNVLQGNAMLAFLHATLYLAATKHRHAQSRRENCDLATVRHRLEENVEKLRGQMNKSKEEACLLLAQILVGCRNTHSPNNLQSEANREKWENEFKAILATHLNRLDGQIAQYRELLRVDPRNGSNQLYKIVYRNINSTQIDSCRQDIISYPQFWVENPKVSVTSCIAHLSSQTKRYPLLEAIFNNGKLRLLGLLPRFVKFFSTLCQYFKYDYSDRITNFSSFLGSQLLPEDLKVETRQTGIEYLKLWNETVRHDVKHKAMRAGGIALRYSGKLDMSSEMKYFLPTRLASECCALVTVMYLVDMNNGLIEKYRQAARLEDSPLQKQAGVLDDSHLVGLRSHDELLPIILCFATREAHGRKGDVVTAGQGAQQRVVYNLAAIERSIGEEYFAAKPYIQTGVIPIFKVVYDDRVKILSSVREGWLPDPVQLSHCESKRIQKDYTNLPEICQLAGKLILTMRFLQPGTDPSLANGTIGEFMARQINLTSHPLFDDIPLSHSLALWQELALQQARLILESGSEDPYPALPVDFKTRLTHDQKAHLRKWDKNKRRSLMLLLNELLMTRLQELRDKSDVGSGTLVNPDWSVNDCLNALTSDFECAPAPDWLLARHSEDAMRCLLDIQ